MHPPDHPIHTWRDFFIHIATIVVGLLIAIALEQSVEWLHHRHLIHQAREQLHEEVSENRKTIAEDQHFLQIAADDSRSNIDLLNASHPDPNTALRFGWRWNATQSSAWDTARETGALALMPYQDVQSFALIYNQQALVQSEATQHIHSYTQSLAPLLRHGDLRSVPVSQLKPEEREQLAESYARNLTEIAVLRDLLCSLNANYADLQHHL